MTDNRHLHADLLAQAADCRNGHHSWTDHGRGHCSACGAAPEPPVLPKLECGCLGDCHNGHTINVGPAWVSLPEEFLRQLRDNPTAAYTTAEQSMAAELLALRPRLAQLAAERDQVTPETSDGYHTFTELYHYRMLYNAALFNEWAAKGLYDVHKSVRHSDGEVCFGDGRWFVVYAQLPTGQISNHYEIGADSVNWYKFQVPIRDAAAEWDGHTPQQAAERLAALLESPVAQREPIGYGVLITSASGEVRAQNYAVRSIADAEVKAQRFRDAGFDVRVIELHEAVTR